MSSAGMRRLLIWRHGRTEWNADGRVQGQEDVGLDEVGRRQATVTAPVLAQQRPAVVVSSDLQRAHHTAQALAQHLGVEIQLDPRLRERGFGVWEGLNSEQMAAQYPQAFARWRVGGEPDVPGLETEAAMNKRVSAGIDSALKLTEGTVCLVTHGGVAKRALSLLLGWPPDVPWGFNALGNCRWLELRSRDDDRWRLQAYNVGAQPVEGDRATAVTGAAAEVPADTASGTTADIEPVVP